MTTVKVPVREDMKSQPGYLAFVDTLQAIFNLHQTNPQDTKWVGVTQTSFETTFPPSVVLDIAKDHPMLAITLQPIVDGRQIGGYGEYNAPLLLKDVQRWGLVADSFGKYAIAGLSGVAEERELFQQPKSLSEIIELTDIKTAITNGTPVIEAVALLPIAENHEFTTEFVPTIKLNPLAHTHYKISVVNQDRFNVYSVLTQGSTSVPVKDIGQDKKLFTWKADRVPELSILEKLLLPSQAGHMIIMVTPVEAPFKSYEIGPDFNASRGDGLKGGADNRFLGIGVQTRGMSVGDVRIGRGSAAGQGSLYQGNVKSSAAGIPVIYHLRFLGMKPYQAESITGEQLSALGKSVSNHLQKT